MSDKNAEKKKIKTLIADLRPGDEQRQLQAIKGLKVHGDHTVVKPLLDVLLNTDSENVRKEIISVLNTVKLTSVPPVIASALTNANYKPIRQILLSSIWNSGLDYREYLKEIVIAAVQGEMMDALECITIIENTEGEFSEEQLYDAQLVLKEYLVENKDDISPKNNLLFEISQLLQEMNDQL